MVRLFSVIWAIVLIFQGNLKGQPQETAPFTYIVFLKDKKHQSYTLQKPSEYLTPKAIERRKKQGIAIDSSDLPVSRFYIDSLRRTGIQIHNVSRWFNSVTFKTENSDLPGQLSNISFIRKTERTTPLPVQMNAVPAWTSELASLPDSSDYGYAYKQIHIHNGEFLHQNGLSGQNMLIAVIDAGFKEYTTTEGFQHIFRQNRLKAVKDFVAHDSEVNNDHPHGMQVFSIIGGEIPGRFLGTAPKADFLLLRSEDATNDIYGFQSEYLVEEDNWIAAAEFADSLGTDIINTSLGYSTFNYSWQNHSYNDMNGTTTRISKAAGIATQKGMIVVVSAGNEGQGPWKYIQAPADARNILAVGAVNSSLVRAGFSSVGPTADNRIKPDVMAVGQGTVFLSPGNNIASGNGTSFSAPVIAGLTACLWQGAAGKTNIEIMDAIRESGNRGGKPDNNYGYGIPDFKKAMLKLNPAFGNKEGLIAYPNPFVSRLNLIFVPCPDQLMTVEIFNTTGKKLYSAVYQITPGVPGELEIRNTETLPRGILIIRAKAGGKIMTTTAIKL